MAVSLFIVDIILFKNDSPVYQQHAPADPPPRHFFMRAAHNLAYVSVNTMHRRQRLTDWL